jgi:hypothetical protein
MRGAGGADKGRCGDCGGVRGGDGESGIFDGFRQRFCDLEGATLGPRAGESHRERLKGCRTKQKANRSNEERENQREENTREKSQKRREKEPVLARKRL